jgi:GH24 family phage-related lysozyme (muramidase)
MPPGLGRRQTSIDDLLPSVPRASPDAGVLCAELIKWEGYRRHMYLDSHGKVATGIGHALPSAAAALALPWCHKATGLRATRTEIRTAFEGVLAHGKENRAPAYQQTSDLVLPPGFAIELATARVEREFLPGLRRLFPHFDGYPLPAQRALVDMAYTLGLGGLGKFRNLAAACGRGDFTTAADHCHRWASRAPRNKATRNLFLEAANPTCSVRLLP